MMVSTIGQNIIQPDSNVVPCSCAKMSEYMESWKLIKCLEQSYIADTVMIRLIG